MKTLIYVIKPEDKEAELEWLHDQKIYPAIEEAWDWTKNLPILKVGMIVSPETASLVVLRHNTQFQQDYKQR